jgi:hypothetical protein
MGAVCLGSRSSGSGAERQGDAEEENPATRYEGDPHRDAKDHIQNEPGHSACDQTRGSTYNSCHVGHSFHSIDQPFFACLFATPSNRECIPSRHGENNSTPYRPFFEC